LKILFAAGPGDVIQAHRHWMDHKNDPGQMSITFSSEFAEFCLEVGADAYIIASCEKRGRTGVWSDRFIIEHRPKLHSRGAVSYHFSEIVYGIGLLISAVRYGADAAVLQSGSTHYFIMSLFRLAGMQVVPVMHNTLWPTGTPPRDAVRRFILWLDGLFFRLAATSVIAVSPECLRQVDQITRGHHCPLHEMRIQFQREVFESILPAPPHDQKPFRIMFAGRINRNKGVFDILHIARAVETSAPGSVVWEICGAGPELDELKARHRAMNLLNIVTIRGWTPPADLREVIARSHLSIVPTRSDFAEGMAMTAIEPILARRPVITSAVVPALEVLRPACIEAKTDDVDSYVSAILKVVKDGEYYRHLCKACAALAPQFYDRDKGFSGILHSAVRAPRL
jgi:glycogen synthase